MIENDPTNVFAAFEILLEEIEAEIECLHEIVNETVRKSNYKGAHDFIERASQITVFRKKVVSLRKEWETLAETPSEAVEEEMLHGRRHNQGRLQKGIRTPEINYYQPILKAINELGGSAKMNAVLEKVEQFMKKELKSVDNEPLRSDSETLRWRNTAQWARNTMVAEGLLKSTSPRGIWEITEAGRIFLTRETR